MKYDNRTRKGLGGTEVVEVPTFKSVLKALSKDIMLKANSTIENAIKDASSYVSISGCQSLWNVDFNKLYEKLECNIPKWNVILNGLQQLIKRNFDSSETIKHFGAIVIDYQKAQDQVNTKFNGLKEFVLTKLKEDFTVGMNEFHQNIIKAKNQLELVSLDNPNIDVTIFITEIQEKNRISSKWEKELEEIYEAGVSILKKKYMITLDQKVNIDSLKGAWNNFKQILAKKVKLMEDEMDRLQGKVIAEEAVVNKKVEEAKKEWTAMKESGFVLPSDQQEAQNSWMPNIQGILSYLNMMEQKSNKLKADWKRVCKAKELLDMELSDPDALDDFELTIKDYKEVWGSLSQIWAKVVEIGETLFTAMNPKKVKESLRGISEEFQELPAKFKQYDAFEDMRAKASKFQTMHNTITDLKGEAMKQRHWKKLLTQLRIKIQFNDLTLIDLWNADLLAHKLVVSDIMAQAIGENAIERFLTDVREQWSHHELDLIKYQQKCRLIRGWDELFTMIDEQICKFIFLLNKFS